MHSKPHPRSRRRLLQLATSSITAAALLPAQRSLGQASTGRMGLTVAPIERADEAVNVFEFEPVAQANMRIPHWTNLDMGVEGEGTLQANRKGFDRFRFRTRRFIDVSEIDTTTRVLDTDLASPIVLAPVASQTAFHREGELAVARAAAVTGHHKMLSTLTTQPIEQVNDALGRPVWFQLYPGATWEITLGLLARAEQAGCEVVALTVDLPASKRERIWRFRRQDNPECQACHVQGQANDRKRMFDGIDLATDSNLRRPALTYEFVERLQAATSMKVVIKGISTAEDAADCIRLGVAGVVVSNHGGRAEESGRSTIESLPEVVQTIDGRMPVLVDSGFRRGTDIYKALALGADAVLIGRPYLWGLGAFGEAGVAKVLTLLQAELEIVMRQAGAPSLASIRRESVEFV